MNSPDQNEQLPHEFNTVLAADVASPSAETDRRILQFAAAHAPARHSAGWKAWMPATAACCLVGVLTLSLMPDLVSDKVPYKLSEMGPEIASEDVTETKQALTPAMAADTDYARKESNRLAPAEDALARQPSARAFSAPGADMAPAMSATVSTIEHGAAQAPEKMQDTLRVPAKFFEPLLALQEQHMSVIKSHHGLAKSSLDTAIPQREKSSGQQADDAVKSSPRKTQVNPGTANNVDYETLRRECDCGLPESLQQALDMLANQHILADHADPQQGSK